jgi:hypothetical protein
VDAICRNGDYDAVAALEPKDLGLAVLLHLHAIPLEDHLRALCLHTSTFAPDPTSGVL